MNILTSILFSGLLRQKPFAIVSGKFDFGKANILTFKGLMQMGLSQRIFSILENILWQYECWITAKPFHHQLGEPQVHSGLTILGEGSSPGQTAAPSLHRLRASLLKQWTSCLLLLVDLVGDEVHCRESTLPAAVAIFWKVSCGSLCFQKPLFWILAQANQQTQACGYVVWNLSAMFPQRE